MTRGGITCQAALCSAWVLGGIAVGVVGLEFLWRSNLTAPFYGLAILAGILLVFSALWTARLAARAGSLLPFAGLLLFFVGFLTLFFGIGAVLLPTGIVLYAVGLARTKVVERRALYLAALLLVLAVADTVALNGQVVGIELAAAAAVATGLGVAASTGQAGGGSEPP